ncbi:nucleotide sugar dehydrogenase [Methanobrevibacter filiformis]|uniref:UDP-N-acetyl-D-mannosamine dehydrogenase n=1 Tax=Methanobrevibacter filiformis TaxID=55758 RepID=A0A165ZUA4_9EURY|nr:nucleotide sugar dehydrogenase [Methanobrevibacter filiformis]KZX11173.1 UDP-N-acetyl-D-glucosamine 6-dehydrogenase [Methanobrevibacter filiformis]
MKLCIIGQGYIGLPTAGLFADNGCNVVGVDINEEVVKSLNNNRIHIEEKGLQELISRVISNGKYTASASPQESDVFIITVPTPVNNKNYSCDLSYVESACKSIIQYIKKGNIVIIESTIAPMSTNKYIKPIFEEEGFKIGEDIYLAHCPERVLPGKIIEELVNNDRIIGGITPKCSEKAAKVYETFVKGEIFKTEAKTAEMSKCMENTFRDVNIALANELTKICSTLGVNALDVIKLANKHPRVNIHSPGPGVGGHCLAIDPYFIYAEDPENAKLIKRARDINSSMPQFVVENVKKIIKNDEKIAILGTSYKGNTDDLRESPAIKIINLLEKEGYSLKIHDPHITNPSYVSFEEVIEDVSLCLILADHEEFKELDYELMKVKMKNPIVFDTKNIVKKSDDIKIIDYGNLNKLI